MKPINISRNSFRFHTWSALLTGLFLFSTLLIGQTIPNPSFETDAFTVYPGYISVNGPITGWTGSPADRVGLNPAGGSAFANNGVIPDGAKVAFIQSYAGGSSTLSTEISGLTAGQKYTVNFRLNARTNNPAQTPVLKIGVDGQPIVNISTLGVQIGGSTTAYRYAAFDFTAAGETAALSLTNDVQGDTTVLVDNFTINASTNGWSYAAWNDDATSGVDSARVYTHAYNLGGSAVDTTINGVLFKAVAVVNPAVANEFSVTGVGSTTSDAGNALITAGGGSAALASRFIYGGNPGLFFITDLVPGMTYEATFYTVAWETGIRAQTFSYGNDRLTVNQDHFNDGQGIRVSYRYVVPASGSIMLTQTPLLPASSLHLYGFANAEVAPPAIPVVGLQPRSQVTTPGSSATLSVTAAGIRPLTFQWYKDEGLLTDQTNRYLTLNGLTADNLGGYTVVVSNANGSATSQVATLTFGSIANPSFEADVFQTWPGYASLNKPISGWTASNLGRAGVNPLPGYPGPFANTGAIPDGSQVGYLQSTGTNWLSTIMNGLTPGQKYTLAFRASARSGQVPVMHATIDSELILDFRVGPAAGTNGYRYIAFDFTPATSAPVLYLTNDAAGDHTVLLDDFRVAPSVTQWSFTNWVDDATAGVDLAKNYSHAYNFGTAVDAVINGVTFKGAPGLNPTGRGFVTAGFTSAYVGDANTITTNGGGAAALMRDFIYGGVPESITLTGLVPGEQYMATVYSVGWADAGGKAFGRAATFSVGADRQTINQDHYGPEIGIRMFYRYVADPSGSVTLTFDATHNAQGTPSTIHTYGFSNYEVASTNAPVFYQQPLGRTVSAGTTVSFTAVVGGEQPLFLQWRKGEANLDGQTGPVLTLASVVPADSGLYTLQVSNIHGALVSIPAVLEVGLAMTNPSFEAETYAYPGYIGAAAPITGWTASIPTGTGINPGADGQSPFANNGGIPDGARVAFIQADGGTLSQVVTGMVVGQTYYVKFFENSRSGYNAPTLAVTLGGETILPAHPVPSGAYRQAVSGPFLATADSAELVFIKTASALGGDTTVLIDNVAVLELPPTPPAFALQPQGSYVKEGESLTLSTIVQGTLPMGYQWQRDEVDVTDATNAVLAFPGILMSQAGSYRLIATNVHGSATSAVAVVRVGLGINELFNTGVDNLGVAFLAGGLADPHYRLISSPDPSWPGPNALVYYDAWPVVAGTYMTNTAISRWIAPRTNDVAGNTAGANNQDGLYVYRTTFLLDSLDPATAEIRGKWAMDNLGVDILLNGVSLGITNNTGFAVFGTFAITNGFVAGSNTLDFVISNAPPAGPTALRVELYGVAMPLPAAAPQIVSQPQSQLVQQLDDVTFSVLATGSPNLTYQWFYEGLDLPNETSRVLRLSRVSQMDQQGNYWVVVSNPQGQQESEHALLTINAPPVAADDYLACSVSQPVAVPAAKLTYNDSEPDGDAISLFSVSLTSTNGGTVTFAAGLVTYNPPAGYLGQDQFTYTLADSRGGRATGHVFVTVGATNFLTLVTPPVLLPNGHFQISYSGVAGYPYTVERATSVLGPWEPFTVVVADVNGNFQVDDPNDPPALMRFYRVTYP